MPPSVYAFQSKAGKQLRGNLFRRQVDGNGTTRCSTTSAQGAR
jgi:hypothetical protein